MISKAIEDRELREHIASLPPDGREVFLIADGTARLSIVSATAMINQMKANHGTGPLETYILGQGYIAAALLSSAVKGNDRIRLDIECGGPMKGMSVEAWASGAVRGYLMANPIPLTQPLASLDTSPIYGPGFLTVTKILEGSRTPFSGRVMLEHGNLAEDLALYFRESEQTPTLFYLSIRFGRNGEARGAGGIFIQALPGCPEETLAALEEKAASFGMILGDAIAEGMSANEYVEREFAGFRPEHIAHAPIGFSCPCSRANFSAYLKSLPAAEKAAILSGDFPLVLECFNCGTDYSFTKEEAEDLFREDL